MPERTGVRFAVVYLEVQSGWSHVHTFGTFNRPMSLIKGHEENLNLFCKLCFFLSWTSLFISGHLGQSIDLSQSQVRKILK